MYTIEHTNGLYTVKCPKGQPLVTTLCPKAAADLLPTHEEILDACDEHFARTGEHLAYRPRAKTLDFAAARKRLMKRVELRNTYIDVEFTSDELIAVLPRKPTLAELLRETSEAIGARGVLQEMAS